ncbi:hypothetical protein MMC28_005424 [Mycoblastus sanguinarius]|nr:hypothetical protein [Mycoblastus sanguinarius]
MNSPLLRGGESVLAKGRVTVADGRITNFSMEADEYKEPPPRQQKYLHTKLRDFIDGATGDCEPESGSESDSSTSTISLQLERFDESSKSACDKACWLRADTTRIPPPLVIGNIEVEATGVNKNLGHIARQLYSALKKKQIRVLRLAPGPRADPISVDFAALDLTDVQNEAKWPPWCPDGYEALSYTWGSSRFTHSVHSNDKIYAVTENLHKALVQLRYSDKARHLWIDALCINQFDNREKSAQIPMMMGIFRSARIVLVWLGDDDPASISAIEFLKNLENKEFRQGILDRTHHARCINQLTMLHIALSELYRRPWFRRTWIRQEVAGARELIVYCGSNELSWNTLKRGWRRLQLISQIIKDHTESKETPLASTFLAGTVKDDFEALKYLKREWRARESAQGFMVRIGSFYETHAGGLMELLMIGQQFESTDPRDKVYAMLGLAGAEIQSNEALETSAQAANIHIRAFEVDYSKTFSEVFQYTAKYFINRDRTLDILCIKASHPDSKQCNGDTIPDIPTWTPDWRATGPKLLNNGQDEYLQIPFAASGQSEAHPQTQNELGRLEVHGWVIDEIDFLIDVTSDTFHMAEIGAFSGLEAYQDHISNFDPRRHTRRCCRTMQGRNVLAPANAEGGDFVFLLLGCRLPIMLRVRDGVPFAAVVLEDEELELVGSCFVPDVMYGEAYEALSTTDPKAPKKLILV